MYGCLVQSFAGSWLVGYMALWLCGWLPMWLVCYITGWLILLGYYNFITMVVVAGLLAMRVTNCEIGWLCDWLAMWLAGSWRCLVMRLI